MKFDWDNPENNHCVDCGISQADSNKLPAVATGINHPDYSYTKSFYLEGGQHANSEVIIRCPRCHREHQLESTFKAMDRYANQYGEEALAKKCGLN